MKILIYSLSFGSESASGQCSKRMADALADLGHEIVVISGSIEEKSWEKGKYILCSRFPSRPSRIMFGLSNLVQYDVRYLAWRIRAKRATKILFTEWKPDVIYGRGSPSANMEIAADISEQYNIPFVIHFADPIPAPVSWDSNVRYRKRCIGLISRLARKADLLSFGNEAMLKYQSKVLGTDLAPKSFISPDPMSGLSLQKMVNLQNSNINLVYFGSIVGNRNPIFLFEAIDRINQEGKPCKLIIYGINTFGLKHSDNILFVGRTKDVSNALNSADIFVDLDGDDEEPVFISSKLKDYLCFPHPILSITPKNSPSHSLLEGMKTAVISNNEIEQIVDALNSIINSRLSESDFDERRELIKMFDPSKVAKDFVEKIEKIIN